MVAVENHLVAIARGENIGRPRFAEPTRKVEARPASDADIEHGEAELVGRKGVFRRSQSGCRDDQSCAQVGQHLLRFQGNEQIVLDQEDRHPFKGPVGE